MIVNNQPTSTDFRHNIFRLALLIATLLLFIVHVTFQQLSNRGNNLFFSNKTLRPEDIFPNEISPSEWVYGSFDAFTYFWQFSWLLYCLTLIFRRSANGFLYLSPNTFTPSFFFSFTAGFLLQTVWICFFQRHFFLWTWLINLLSFLILSVSWLIITNNLAINKKFYETEQLDRDIFCLRLFTQNGIAFFVCWTGIQFVLHLNVFLRNEYALSRENNDTISLLLLALIAVIFFFGPDFIGCLQNKCSYLFSPWFIFILLFWGIVENNWLPKNPTRNGIIAMFELLGSVVSAIFVLSIFTIRIRTSKIGPIV